MSQRDVRITTADGVCRASLHVPDQSGTWPGVIMYPDAGSLRPVFRDMGQKLADMGYVVLIPDVYYRTGDWAPFDMHMVFSGGNEMERISAMIKSVTANMVGRDAHSFTRFLLSLPETAGTAVGTTGYCMGGRLSLLAAGFLRERVAASAAIHAGGVASDHDPDSPHHQAASIRARIYVAGASNDPGFTDEQRQRLERSLAAAGVEHTIETYPASHGFAVADTPVHDPEAEARHWRATAELFSTALH